MNYEIFIHDDAKKEWRKLPEQIREQFKAKLAKLIANPKVESKKLRGSELKHCYKIKLSSSGYRLVYEVNEGELVILVIAVGKRQRNEVYEKAIDRFKREKN